MNKPLLMIDPDFGELLPADLSVETALALAAAFKAGHVSAEELAERLAGGFENVGSVAEAAAQPAYYGPNAEEEARTWAERWSLRALLRVGELWGSLSFFVNIGGDERLAMLRAVRAARWADVQFGWSFDAKDLAARERRLKVAEETLAAWAMLAHVPALGVLPDGSVVGASDRGAATPADVFGEAVRGIPSSVTTLNTLAAATWGSESFVASEGDVLALLRLSSSGAVKSRVEVRELLHAAVERGVAVARRAPDGGPFDPERRPTPSDALRGVCPLCAFRLAARKNLAMELGVNLGTGRCPACEADLSLRLVRDGFEDVSGDELLVLRGFERSNLPARFHPPGGFEPFPYR